MDSAIVTLNATAPIIGELSGEIDEANCRLLGPFALVIQAIMGVAVLGSLLLKRAREKPKRKWKVWMADISKQVLSQGLIHLSNVAISDLIAKHKNDNPCSLYALNILVDTTFGVFLLWLFLRLTTPIIVSYQPTYRTGFYGSPKFSILEWAKQLAHYVVCLALMKAIVVALFSIFPWLLKAATWVLSWVKSDEGQVFIVMLIFPLVMNVLQFLIIDSFLKSSESNGDSPNPNSSDDDEDAHRAFLDDSQSDDEDDDGERDLEAQLSTKKRAAVVENGKDAFKNDSATGEVVLASEGEEREEQLQTRNLDGLEEGLKVDSRYSLGDDDDAWGFEDEDEIGAAEDEEESTTAKSSAPAPPYTPPTFSTGTSNATDPNAYPPPSKPLSYETPIASPEKKTSLPSSTSSTPTARRSKLGATKLLDPIQLRSAGELELNEKSVAPSPTYGDIRLGEIV